MFIDIVYTLMKYCISMWKEIENWFDVKTKDQTKYGNVRCLLFYIYFFLKGKKAFVYNMYCSTKICLFVLYLTQNHFIFYYIYKYSYCPTLNFLFFIFLFFFINIFLRFFFFSFLFYQVGCPWALLHLRYDWSRKTLLYVSSLLTLAWSSASQT
jgi:hypothetical protein